MFPDSDTCYRALTARDSRFDGVFFVGVSTTGIYCRPVCPARTPGRDRCHFFAHAAGAEKNGFRPCLRCRPELAPGFAPVDSNNRIAHAASDLIQNGALSGDSADSAEMIEQLKQLKGIGDWTAQYVAMRLLHWPDAFPESDLGLLKAVEVSKLREIREIAEAWRPWRAYAAMYLWKSLSDVTQ